MTNDHCRVEGYRAMYDRIEEEDNPYAEGTKEYELWSEGWNEAFSEWFYKDWEPEWYTNR